MLSKVVGDLLIAVPHQSDKKLFGEKLGGTPVEVEVDAILILCVVVLEIVGKSRPRGSVKIPRVWSLETPPPDDRRQRR